MDKRWNWVHIYVRDSRFDWGCYIVNFGEFKPELFRTNCQWTEWWIQVYQFLEATFWIDPDHPHLLDDNVEKYYN